MGEEPAVAHVQGFGSHEVALADEVGGVVSEALGLSSRVNPLLPRLLVFRGEVQPRLLIKAQTAFLLDIPAGLCTVKACTLRLRGTSIIYSMQMLHSESKTKRHSN